MYYVKQHPYSTYQPTAIDIRKSLSSSTNSNESQTTNDTVSLSPPKPTCPPSALRKSTSMLHLSSNNPTYNNNKSSPHATSPPSSSSSSNGTKRSISFTTLEISEYPVTVGDNPAVPNGVPLQLDWEHNSESTQVLDVEQYEMYRPEQRTKSEM